MPTRNINLTEHYDQFVSALVDTGRYQNVSEVLRAGLRLLEQHTQAEEQKLTMLKGLAAEGFRSLDQGEGLDLPGEGGLRKAISRLGRRAARASKTPASE